MQTAENVAKLLQHAEGAHGSLGAEKPAKACYAARDAGKFDEIVPFHRPAGVAIQDRMTTAKQGHRVKDEGLRDGTTYGSCGQDPHRRSGGVVSAVTPLSSAMAGACGDERQARRTTRPNRSASSAASRSRAAIPTTKWASARCSPCQNCSNARSVGQRHRPLGTQPSLRRAGAYCADTLGIPMDKLNVNGGDMRSVTRTA